MAMDGFGFDPPRRALSAEIAWVLSRAFGEVGAESERGAVAVDGEEVGRLASTMRLGARIGFRQPAERLRHELGDEAAGLLTDQRRRATARAAVLEELALEVERLAAAGNLRIVVLKGMALQLLGVTPAGSRQLADVDVLVAEADLGALVAVLEDAGFADSGAFEGEYHHHLPPLVHPKLGVLEVHWRLPGVVVGRGEARLESLIAADACRPIADGRHGMVPREPVLGAHAIAHAMVQNRRSPGAQSVLGTIADLIDLAGGGDPRGLVDVAAGIVGPPATRREVTAAGELGEALRTGGAIDPSSDAGRLLHHGLSGLLDPVYREALLVDAWREALVAGDWAKLRRRTARALGEGRAAPRKGSGRRGGLGRIGRAVRKLASVGSSWVRVRWGTTWRR